MRSAQMDFLCSFLSCFRYFIWTLVLECLCYLILCPSQTFYVACLLKLLLVFSVVVGKWFILEVLVCARLIFAVVIIVKYFCVCVFVVVVKFVLHLVRIQFPNEHPQKKSSHICFYGRSVRMLYYSFFCVEIIVIFVFFCLSLVFSEMNLIRKKPVRILHIILESTAFAHSFQLTLKFGIGI